MPLAILDPRDLGTREARSLNPRVSTLKGKVVGIRHKPRWTNFKVFGKEVEQILRRDLEVRDVVWVEFDETKEHAIPKAVMDEFTGKIDAAIVGLGA